MAATTTTTTTSSSWSCSGLFSSRSSSSNKYNNGSSSGCGKIDGVAMWLINGVTMAFFASLNRCSCIRIATDEEDGEDANDLPLMFNDGNIRHDGVAVTSATTTGSSRRRTGKGNKNSSGEALVLDHH